MATASLLVELVTEELPPKALKVLGDAFANGIVAGLAKTGLVAATGDSAGAAAHGYATPRRLAVLVPDVADQAPDRDIVEKLMPTSVALDADGKPTAALRKRLEKSGHADVLDAPDWRTASSEVRIEGEGKAATVHLRSRVEGRRLSEALTEVVAQAIAALPIPKRMTYQRHERVEGRDVESNVQFVRPAHALVALHGRDVVPMRVLGLDADRVTAGHRFLGMRHMTLATADDYASTLRDDGRVLAGFAERRTAIVAALVQAAGADRVVMPDALLDEVTALVEWPAVYRGTFDAAFLDVPQECLILTMQQNQKYFALTDAAGRLVDRFLVVSNIATDEPSRIVGGNERVLRARLADAKFFFDQDRRTPLVQRVEKLRTVVYHNQLGSQYDRMLRVEALADRIARMLDGDRDDAKRAARLAKADLVTDMVGEFPELQGLMGRYYATHDGEKRDVATAIEEQYRPRFAGDALPATATGTVLALADKLETLVGLFGVGAAPTGDKDPFALRRHALGLIRILVEGDLRVRLAAVFDAALDTCLPPGADRHATHAALTDFVRVRLAGYLRDLGYSKNEVEAVVFDLDAGPLADLSKRLAAVRAFAVLPEAGGLASADKRVRNILAKSDDARVHQLLPQLLTDAAEIALYEALGDVGPRAEVAYDAGDFTAALLALASLKAPVDRFFDEVMVNADNPAIRGNRLGLLTALHRPMNRVADLSKLAS